MLQNQILLTFSKQVIGATPTEIKNVIKMSACGYFIMHSEHTQDFESM